MRRVIPPSPATDDLNGATEVLDSNLLIDFFDFHHVHDLWNGGKPVDEARLVQRCTRMRDALLLGMGFHAMKARTYTLTHEPLNLLERFAPPEANGLQTAFVRAAQLYVRAEVLSDWLIVNPDDDGNPEPTGSRADRELARVASEYGLPLITLDGDLRKRAAKAGVVVLSPHEYLAQTKLDMQKELNVFYKRYLDRLPAYAAAQPADPAGVEELLRWILEVLYRGAFSRAA